LIYLAVAKSFDLIAQVQEVGADIKSGMTFIDRYDRKTRNGFHLYKSVNEWEVGFA
jgi:hypothetical protein